jgi:uncharacterized membrane protein YkvI
MLFKGVDHYSRTFLFCNSSFHYALLQRLGVIGICAILIYAPYKKVPYTFRKSITTVYMRYATYSLFNKISDLVLSRYHYAKRRLTSDGWLLAISDYIAVQHLYILSLVFDIADDMSS